MTYRIGIHIIWVCFLLFSSCNRNREQSDNTVKIYDWDDEIVSDFKPKNMIKYISEPEKTDCSCIEDIHKAKSDIANGKLVFSEKAGLGFGHFRYERELKELCNQMGLTYNIDLIGCVIIVGQTYGCYTAYMDKILFEKYGPNFKTDLHNKADSLFLLNAIQGTVSYMDLDNSPKLPNESNTTNDFSSIAQVENPDVIFKSDNWDESPFMDIGFIVHKDSTISDFRLRSFVSKGNDKYQKELFDIAVKKIKLEYPIWIPGSINDIPLQSTNNVRIHFYRKKGG